MCKHSIKICILHELCKTNVMKICLPSRYKKAQYPPAQLLTSATQGDLQSVMQMLGKDLHVFSMNIREWVMDC